MLYYLRIKQIKKEGDYINILIFRTARLNNIYCLIDYLNKKYEYNCNIWIYLQGSIVDEIKNKYNNINFIKTNEGFIKYKDYKNDKLAKNTLKNLKFNSIYIPNTSPFFEGFNEVKRIVCNLGYNKMLFYNNAGNIFEENISLLNLKVEMMLDSKLFIRIVIYLANILELIFKIFGFFRI